MNPKPLKDTCSLILEVIFLKLCTYLPTTHLHIDLFISGPPEHLMAMISYVQLKREGNLCIIKGKICPEHKVHAKLYQVTLIVYGQNKAIKSIECHDCIASQGGCKHTIAFLMWVHRRSEDPSCEIIKFNIKMTIFLINLDCMSMHQLVLKYKERSCDISLGKIILTNT